MRVIWRSVMPELVGTTVQPDAVCPLVEAEPAGEEAVAVGVLGNVVGADPGGPEVAGHALGPLVQVFGRVGAGDRLAGGAGRGVHPHDLLHRHRAQAEGVVVPQVVLDGEGKFGHILEALDVFGLTPASSSFFL